jgi:hypothetical protein
MRVLIENLVRLDVQRFSEWIPHDLINADDAAVPVATPDRIA